MTGWAQADYIFMVLQSALVEMFYILSVICDCFMEIYDQQQVQFAGNGVGYVFSEDL